MREICQSPKLFSETPGSVAALHIRIGMEFYWPPIGQGKAAIGRGKKSSILRRSLFGVFVVASLVSHPTTGHAAITWTGNVTPSFPTYWSHSTTGYIGNTADGSVLVTSGSDLKSSYGYVGYGQGVTGAVTVDGTGAWWSSTNPRYIGYSGTGVVNVINGGVVGGTYSMTDYNTTYLGYDATARGTLNVRGAGSSYSAKTLLYIGYSGYGELNVLDGGYAGTGAVNGGSITQVGYNSGSTGFVLVDGTNSRWDPGDSLYVGGSGDATVTITNGGAISDWVSSGCVQSNSSMTIDNGSAKFHSLYIVSGSLRISGGGTVDSNSYSHIEGSSGLPGVVTVDGTNSKWNASRLNVGGQGNGTLRITNGGTVISSGFDGNSFDIACIGFSAGSTSEVTVEGAGSTWTHSSNLYVGHYGNGTLRISGGANVSAGSTVYVADGVGSTGTISFGSGGGTLTTGTLAVSSPSQLTGSGTIYTGGFISDFNLLFDSAHAPNRLVLADQPNQNITLDLDLDKVSTSKFGIGYRGSGSLIIRDGIQVQSSVSYLGYQAGSRGLATIEGNGSMWNTASGLFNGYDGSGALKIAGGAKVSDTYGYIGYNSGSTGLTTVEGNGSTWTNSTSLCVGYYGSAALRITGGGKVSSSSSYNSIGYKSGSTGRVSIDGAASRWTNSSGLYVGYAGAGTLTIVDGGEASNTYGYIGFSSGSTGLVNVDGGGSTWTNSSGLYVGRDGNGSLNLSGGGTITATSVSVNSQSLLALDVGNGSLLTVGGGTGTLTNNGTVRLMAAAGIPAGTYTPISAGTWSGTGAYQAIGGKWNADHTFTASAVETDESGSPVAIDLFTKQRILVDDPATGWSVGASFLAATSSMPLSLTASAISGDTLTGLESLLVGQQSVLGGWNFTNVTGYTSGDPAYLSFGIGTGYARNDLQIWHYVGGSWTEYASTDLTCNGTYASFTVTGFGGYAVTGVPMEVFLLGDANKDGTVNVADLTDLLNNYNKTGMLWANGDFNSDGNVNVADLTVLLNNYNKTYGAVAGTAVPEPSVGSLLGIGAISLLANAWRRQKAV